MSKVRILWVDDEIDLLRSQIMFLEEKGYEVDTVSNGYDAIEKCEAESFNVVFLDESMPGIGGLDTLERIKAIKSNLPIVMITKNEAENIMEEAIGKQITDYLIKPVKPTQVLLTLKKILDSQGLVSQATTSAYQQNFAKISGMIQMGPDYDEWINIYKELIRWELELENANSDMMQVMTMQKTEANNEFSKYVGKRYQNWITDNELVMSHNLLERKVFPAMENGKPTVLVVIDNLRYDQYKAIEPILQNYFRLEKEEVYCSILPTATQYARNAIFAGISPAEMAQEYPDYWRNDADEGGKNNYEDKFLAENLKRSKKDIKFSYQKVTNHKAGNTLVDNAHNLLNNELNVIVYNFVDMLSHARTEMEVLKELASDEAAYRSITRSWFEHSPLLKAIERIQDKDINLIITTDHGTIRVQSPIKVVGDRNTTSNLRYKMGKSLNYNAKEVFEIRDPESVNLPKVNMSSSFIFANNSDFFVYPNNYSHYANYFKNTFQHGGVSLEEMLIPIAFYSTK